MTRTATPERLSAAVAGGIPAVLDLVHRSGGAPLRDDGVLTFVYVGQADAVRFRHWMDIFPPVPAFSRIAGAGVWHMSMEIPAYARVEYQLEVRRFGRGRLTLDPLNPRTAGGPFGSNSVVTGAGYRVPDSAVASPAVDRGWVHELPVQSKVFGGTRHCRIYRPANHGDDPLPLVAVHDGTEYLKYAALGTVLDNLNAAGRPVAALLLDPVERLVEYGGDPRHAAYLVEEALPAVQDTMALDMSRTVAVGASFGAVASLHAAHAHPGTFSALALQSGSFVEALGGRHRRGAAFAPVIEFMDRLKSSPGPLPQRMHLSCGTFDGLIADDRRMAAWLRRRGIDVGWADVPDGHHWGLWRDTLGEALTFAFG